MTDSPAVLLPLDPKEKPILDKLLYIREELELLKADRTQYVKSQDVIALYGQVIEQVESINTLRVTKRDVQNRGKESTATKPAGARKRKELTFLIVHRSGYSPRQLLPAHLARFHDHWSQPRGSCSVGRTGSPRSWWVILTIRA